MCNAFVLHCMNFLCSSSEVFTISIVPNFDGRSKPATSPKGGIAFEVVDSFWLATFESVGLVIPIVLLTVASPK